jgi:hypothetical protein
VTQGYFAYTYLVANPTDETIHKVIVDAGEWASSRQVRRCFIGSFGQSRYAGFGQWKGHHSFFGGLFHNLPLGPASWTPFGSNSNQVGNGSW